MFWRPTYCLTANDAETAAAPPPGGGQPSSRQSPRGQGAPGTRLPCNPRPPKGSGGNIHRERGVRKKRKKLETICGKQYCWTSVRLTEKNLARPAQNFWQDLPTDPTPHPGGSTTYIRACVGRLSSQPLAQGVPWPQVEDR